jgi:hypothetical protein
VPLPVIGGQLAEARPSRLSTEKVSTIPGTGQFSSTAVGLQLVADRYILETMEFDETEEVKVPCPLCGVHIPKSQLLSCFICNGICCEYCSKQDFGRTFCSTTCRGFFFWGDGEQDEKDF